MGMCGVCASECGCTQLCAGVHRRVSVGVGACYHVWSGVHGCVHVCGMNFQNFFQRIESLHQRTLIRILYEFFSLVISCLHLHEVALESCTMSI